jgi:hypothetical protein
MMKTAVLVLLLSLTSCASGTEQQLPSAAGGAGGAKVASFAREQAAPQSGSVGERMIVKTAALTLVVDSAADAPSRATTFIDGQGGYVVESKQWRDAG